MVYKAKGPLFESWELSRSVNTVRIYLVNTLYQCQFSTTFSWGGGYPQTLYLLLPETLTLLIILFILLLLQLLVIAQRALPDIHNSPSLDSGFFSDDTAFCRTAFSRTRSSYQRMYPHSLLRFAQYENTLQQGFLYMMERRRRISCLQCHQPSKVAQARPCTDGLGDAIFQCLPQENRDTSCIRFGSSFTKTLLIPFL